MLFFPSSAELAVSVSPLTGVKARSWDYVPNERFHFDI